MALIGWIVLAVFLMVLTAAVLWCAREQHRDWVRDGDWASAVLLGITVAVVVGCGALTVAAWGEVRNRATLTPSTVTLTVSSSETGTRLVAVTTKVGNSVMVQMIPSRYTAFKTVEEPNKVFEASGHHQWNPGRKVRLTVYRRNGAIVSYDVEGVE